jgi:phage recombination protein Bet
MSASHEVITASEVAAAHQQRASLVTKFAERFGLEPNKMMATLKATAFKGEVTNEQMAALLIVADQHKLNPFTKEIYAFPSRAGIVPVVGVDGWARIVNEHPEFDGMEFSLAGEKGSEAYTCTIYRKDRAHPTSVTEYMSECRRQTDPWSTHPLRMLRHKAMIQCARLAFSFAGIYDPDEAERVLAAEGAIDVTPAKDEKSKGKIGPKKLREYIEQIEALLKREDGPGLLEIIRELDQEEYLQVWGALRSWERTAFKKLEDKAKAADCGVGLNTWALEVLKTCKDKVSAETAWNAIQKAYDENGEQPPDELEATYLDIKSELPDAKDAPL